jgi:hypothetical protein
MNSPHYIGFDVHKGGNAGTSMISKSQGETEVSSHLEDEFLEARVRYLNW